MFSYTPVELDKEKKVVWGGLHPETKAVAGATKVYLGDSFVSDARFVGMVALGGGISSLIRHLFLLLLGFD